ncbi:aldehyde dehydrogenase [Nocardioides sp. Iso805N]|uniref:aldehyde dehydrogenase n=1 Tax=Nocardioides sp. Iso805N TaxID=1283287 RepID=UPI00037881EF|nr:aldehyde dehydrogenase [Nocardioides sp. Iso805N]
MYHYEGTYAAGTWVPGEASRIDVHSPATDELLGSVTDASAADVAVAVAAARTALDDAAWAGLTPAERGAALGRLADGIERRTEELAALLSAEVGSPLRWARFAQIGTTVGVLRTYAKLAEEHTFEEVRRSAMGGEVLVRQVPVGVVGAIIPWNAPLFIAALKVGPALAAGCTVVLKPSPEAPLAVCALAAIAEEAGLPPGVLNIVPGGVATGEALVAAPGVDKISFTGSTAAGKRIGAACAADVRRCSLELGGKSAAILLDDLELDRRTVSSIVSGVMANSGQVCVAQTRLLIPGSRYDEIVGVLAEAVDSLVVGDPAEEETQVGPVISAHARDRILAQVGGAVEDGARVVAGGSPYAIGAGSYVRPTLLADVDNAMSIAREELFGPVGVAIRYEDEAEAVAIANDSPYGLAGAVWSADAERAAEVALRLRVGSVAVNSSAPLDFGSPFGGFKQSGIGREGGPEGLAAFLEPQTIIR